MGNNQLIVWSPLCKRNEGGLVKCLLWKQENQDFGSLISVQKLDMVANACSLRTEETEKEDPRGLLITVGLAEPVNSRFLENPVSKTKA